MKFKIYKLLIFVVVFSLPFLGGYIVYAQDYTVKKHVAINSSDVKSLLIVYSIEPQTSATHQEYREKVEMIENVIASHWDLKVDSIDVSKYKLGDINDYDALYIIEEYGETLPYELFIDVLTTGNKEIIWSGFGSEELVASLFNQFLYPHEPDDNFVSVEYKGESFSLKGFNYLKRYHFLEDSKRIKVLSTLNTQEPLIIDIDDKYLILPFETPFTYSTNDYTLVFLDVLHNSLGHHEKERTALLRLEDVNPGTYRKTGKLSRVYRYLKGKNIPFHIAFIARYINPNEDYDITIKDTYFFNKLLKKMVAEGLGTLVQHGYTHQVGDSVSGVGFEFWDGDAMSPLKYDSEEFVRDKVESVRSLMKDEGLPVPDIWETPHYALSDLDNKIINEYYPIRYGDLKRFGDFPFVVEINRTVYIPENIGYVYEYADVYRIQDELKKISVFEDPTASFFWHPWRDVSELEQLVSSFETYGYSFAGAYDLVEHNNAEGFLELQRFRETEQDFVKTVVTEVWITLCFALFTFGAFLYSRNVYRINKYFKIIGSFDITVPQLIKLAKDKGARLPTIAVFVPARNEGYVIENTIRRLAKLHYVKGKFKVFVIVDRRELDDNVEILTKNVVARLSKELNKKFGYKLLTCFEVPKHYSGVYGSEKKAYGKSSKGRALNYALQKLEKTGEWEKIDMIGVLDADGRLDKNVIKEAAYRWIIDGSRLLQGMVFQVSNFERVSLVGMAAALELAIHHSAIMAHRLLTEKGIPQFLAGTNYFIGTKLVMDVGGWDSTALVEDAELAIRVYVKKGVVAQWLSRPETEQTPPNFSIYRRQRDRWVRGHLGLVKYVINAKIPFKVKFRFLFEIYMTIFRVVIDLGIPVLGWGLLFSGILLDLGPVLRIYSLFLLVFSLLTWDFYGYMYRKLFSYGYIPNGKKSTNGNKLIATLFNKTHGYFVNIYQSIKLILFMPVFVFAQSVPRITGITKHFFKIQPGIWYKTERTKEGKTE